MQSSTSTVENFMKGSQDEQGRPNCEACKFKKTGKNKAYFNMDPCRKGHSVFFTCCVTDCSDFKQKGKEKCSSETT